MLKLRDGHDRALVARNMLEDVLRSSRSIAMYAGRNEWRYDLFGLVDKKYAVRKTVFRVRSFGTADPALLSRAECILAGLVPVDDFASRKLVAEWGMPEDDYWFWVSANGLTAVFAKHSYIGLFDLEARELVRLSPPTEGKAAARASKLFSPGR